MKWITVSFLLFGVIGVISCEPNGNVQEIVTANNLFSASVYKGVLEKNSDKNFIVSPFSAGNILALAYSGAKGETGQELRSALHLPDRASVENAYKSLLPTIKSSGKNTLNSANKLYAKNGFSINENYKKIASDAYHSAVEGIDFVPQEKAAAIMNKWVEEQTNNKIKNLVNPKVLDDLTRLVLVNALHFKANFSSTFLLGGTLEADFYKTGKDVVKVQTMHEIDYYNYYESPEINAKFLELPFVGEDASLIIVLPNEREGVRSLETQIDKVFGQPKFTREFVRVALPKFKINTSIDFVEILKSVGVSKAFDEKNADFSGISGKPGDLYISDVLQKAFVDVSENGVEAAAATYVAIAIPISNFQNPDPQKQFIADHPFIFYIKVKNVILFVGKVVDPTN